MKTYILVSGIDSGATEAKILNAKNDKEAFKLFKQEMMNDEIEIDEPLEGKLFEASEQQIGFHMGDGDSESWYALFKL